MCKVIPALTATQQATVTSFSYVAEIVAHKYANKPIPYNELLSTCQLAIVKLIATQKEPYKYTLVYQACKMDVIDAIRSHTRRMKRVDIAPHGTYATTTRDARGNTVVEETEQDDQDEREAVAQDLDGFDMCLLKDVLKNLPSDDVRFLSDYSGMPTKDILSKYSYSRVQLQRRVAGLYDTVKGLLA